GPGQNGAGRDRGRSRLHPCVWRVRQAAGSGRASRSLTSDRSGMYALEGRFMQKRSVTIPWRHMGRCVALLAGLLVTRPVWAGTFEFPDTGTPDLTVHVIPNKWIAAPGEVVEYQLVIRNNGTAVAPNTRVQVT